MSEMEPNDSQGELVEVLEDVDEGLETLGLAVRELQERGIQDSQRPLGLMERADQLETVLTQVVDTLEKAVPPQDEAEKARVKARRERLNELKWLLIGVLAGAISEEEAWPWLKEEGRQLRDRGAAVLNMALLAEDLQTL